MGAPTSGPRFCRPSTRQSRFRSCRLRSPMSIYTGDLLVAVSLTGLRRGALAYYLASGRIAGCLTTTGAATKLGSSGITDAKLHNIPAVYVIALNSTLSIGRSPLQDVSEHGMNIVPQLRAELGDGLIVIDDIDSLGDRLALAQPILAA